MDALTHDQWLIIWLILSGILGLTIGSFLNVVVYRVPNDLSILKPGSHCPHCKKGITRIDNVPVVSYLILKGKCRWCGGSISFRYPAVEILTAAVVVVTTWRVGLHIHTFGYALFFAGLIALSAIDIDCKLLPKKVVYASGALLFLFLALSCVYTGHYNRLRDAAIVGAIYTLFLYVMWLGTGGKALGFGDVRLAFFLGAAMGYYGYIVGYAGMLFSFFLGSVLGIAIAAITGGGRKMKIPFGPFLAAGTMAAVWLAPVIHDFIQVSHV